MECPRDHKEMNTRKHEAGFMVDECPQCDGMWLDKGELEAVKARTEQDFQASELRIPDSMDFSFSRRMQETFGTISCPRCGATMDTREYEGWSDIVIDVCPKGCGLWLDHNELRALVNVFEKNEYEKDAMWATLTSAFGG